MKARRYAFFSVSALALGAAVAGFAFYTPQQNGKNPPGEWRDINGDASATRYSPLDQINATNFNNLRVAKRWRETFPSMRAES